jgi:hypothetical protein
MGKLLGVKAPSDVGEVRLEPRRILDTSAVGVTCIDIAPERSDLMRGQLFQHSVRNARPVCDAPLDRTHVCAPRWTTTTCMQRSKAINQEYGGTNGWGSASILYILC